MKRERLSVEQIVAVLKQLEVGVPVAELIRQVGISEQTLYRWKKQYNGLETDQIRLCKQLQEENARLKRLVAELTLDKAMLQDVLSTNGDALAAPPGGAVQLTSYHTLSVGKRIYHSITPMKVAKTAAGKHLHVSSLL